MNPKWATVIPRSSPAPDRVILEQILVALISISRLNPTQRSHLTSPRVAPSQSNPLATMPEAAVQGKRRTFKKFTFRGVDLDALLTMKPVELLPLLSSRARRKFHRGLTRKPMALIKKLNKAKKEAPEHEKPEVVKTHLRNVSSYSRFWCRCPGWNPSCVLHDINAICLCGDRASMNHCSSI